MRIKQIFVLLALIVLLSGCGVSLGLKPQALDRDQQIDNSVADLEDALETLDPDQLEEIISDQVIIDGRETSSTDTETWQEFLGNHDSIEVVEIIEHNRQVSLDGAAITAELILRIREGTSAYYDKSMVEITLIKTGDRWSEEKWIITGIYREHEITNPAPSQADLLRRLETALKTKDFSDLNNLLADTVACVDGSSVRFSHKSAFIGLLENDFAGVTVDYLAFSDPVFGNNKITATLQITATATLTRSREITNYSLEVTEQAADVWTITKIAYQSKVFGLF